MSKPFEVDTHPAFDETFIMMFRDFLQHHEFQQENGTRPNVFPNHHHAPSRKDNVGSNFLVCTTLSVQEANILRNC